jgi:hypothetical protein
MKRILLSKWEFALALLVLLVTIGYVVQISLRMNDGHLIYALDDAYIHMSIAKNFVMHNVWGITEHGFTSSSSSIIWPLLISISYVIFGVNEYTLLIMNIIFAALFVYAAHRILKAYNINQYLILALLLILIFAAPLPALLVSGMEHILQIITYIGSIFLASKLLTGEVKHESLKRYRGALLCMLTLASLTRYEGFVLTSLVALLFFFRKEFKYPLLILGLTFAPIAIYGAISIFNGWYFFPNSLILKGIQPAETLHDLLGLLYNRYELLELNYHVVFYIVCIPLAFFGYYLQKRKLDSIGVSLIITFILLAVHVFFFRYGWFFRYEAYIVITALLFGAIAVIKTAEGLISARGMILWKRAAAGSALAVFTAAALFYMHKTHEDRIILGTKWAPVAMNDRYIEHVYTAKFLEEYYNNSTVVLNDVGAAAFYSDVKILDIYGLASFEPAKFAPYLFTSRTDVFRSKTGTYRKEFDKWITGNNGEIAILQTGGWYIRSFIPPEWEKIGMWEIPSNVVFGDKEVSFYCINPSEKERMVQALRKFSARLHPGVTEKGLYIRRDDTAEMPRFSLTGNVKKNFLSPIIVF